MLAAAVLGLATDAVALAPPPPAGPAAVRRAHGRGRRDVLGCHPVTPSDVACNLDRDMNLKLGGYYGVIFDRVRSIAGTGPRQVTIALTQPGYWLPGQMASIGGIVIDRSFAQKHDQDHGARPEAS